MGRLEIERGEVSALVRENATRYGVSERTIWRWYAAGEIDLLEEEKEERSCRYCGEPLPEEATIRRRFCDAFCRVYKHRAKLTRRTFASNRRSDSRP